MLSVFLGAEPAALETWQSKVFVVSPLMAVVTRQVLMVEQKLDAQQIQALMVSRTLASRVWQTLGSVGEV